MLSYIVPQTVANEEKTLPPRSLNLNHNLNLTSTPTSTSTVNGNNKTTVKTTRILTVMTTTNNNTTLTATSTTTMTTVTANSTGLSSTSTTASTPPKLNAAAVTAGGNIVGGRSMAAMSGGKFNNKNQQQNNNNNTNNKNGNNVENLKCDEMNRKFLLNERAQIGKNSKTLLTPDKKSDNNDINLTLSMITTAAPASASATTTTITETITKTIVGSNGLLSERGVSGGVSGKGGGGGGDDGDCDDINKIIINKSSDDVSGGANNIISGQQSQTKKSKISKVGAKNTTLKRVSFGSSKGSMVETLIFETPTPLPEHAERTFGYPTVSPSSSINTQVDNSIDNRTALSSPLSQHQQHHHHHHHQQQHKISSSNTTNNNTSSCLDDSGIDLQEELERSKVRVTFYQSNKPQQVSPPDSYLFYSNQTSILPSSDNLTTTYLLDNCNKSIVVGDNMAAVETTAQISYDRQISTESGWDNPFRPGGDLSREADEIVNLIKGGKPITPTGDANQSIANGTASRSIENGKAVVDGATKTEVSHLQSTPAQNGTKSSSQSADGKSTSQTQVSNQVIPGPTSASHVVIQDKKKKKCNCCVIQ